MDERGPAEPVYVDQFRGRLFLLPRAGAPEARELADTADDVGRSVSAALTIAATRRPLTDPTPAQRQAAHETRQAARALLLEVIGLEPHEYRPEIRVGVWDDGNGTIRVRPVAREGDLDGEITLDRSTAPLELGAAITAMIHDAVPSRGTIARAFGAPEGRTSVYARLGVAYVCSTRRAALGSPLNDFAPPYARIDLRSDHAAAELGRSTLAALDASDIVDGAADERRDRWRADFVASTELAESVILSPRTGLVTVDRCGPEVRIGTTALIDPTPTELGTVIEAAIHAAL